MARVKGSSSVNRVPASSPSRRTHIDCCPSLMPGSTAGCCKTDSTQRSFSTNVALSIPAVLLAGSTPSALVTCHQKRTGSLLLSSTVSYAIPLRGPRCEPNRRPARTCPPLAAPSAWSAAAGARGTAADLGGGGEPNGVAAGAEQAWQAGHLHRGIAAPPTTERYSLRHTPSFGRRRMHAGPTLTGEHWDLGHLGDQCRGPCSYSRRTSRISIPKFCSRCRTPCGAAWSGGQPQVSERGPHRWVGNAGNSGHLLVLRGLTRRCHSRTQPPGRVTFLHPHRVRSPVPRSLAPLGTGPAG